MNNFPQFLPCLINIRPNSLVVDLDDEVRVGHDVRVLTEVIIRNEVLLEQIGRDLTGVCEAATQRHTDTRRHTENTYNSIKNKK